MSFVITTTHESSLFDCDCEFLIQITKSYEWSYQYSILRLNSVEEEDEDDSAELGAVQA